MICNILLIPIWEKLPSFRAVPFLEFWAIYWAGGEKHLSPVLIGLMWLGTNLCIATSKAQFIRWAKNEPNLFFCLFLQLSSSLAQRMKQKISIGSSRSWAQVRLINSRWTDHLWLIFVSYDEPCSCWTNQNLRPIPCFVAWNFKLGTWKFNLGMRKSLSISQTILKPVGYFPEQGMNR